MKNKPTEVWRRVDGMAIRCTTCRFNEEQILYGDGEAVGSEFRCTAEGEICDFMKKKIDGQKAYPGFREAYREIPKGALKEETK